MADPDNSSEVVSSHLRALAHPTRLAITRLLADGELCVCHLQSELDLSAPLVSHHLRTLREGGLVEARQHSYWTYYALRPEALKALAAQLADLAQSALAAGNPRPCPPQPEVTLPPLRKVGKQLAHEFKGTFSAETITRFVEESAEPWWADLAVEKYIPEYVERYARERLRALGEWKGVLVKHVPQVLFVCVHNAGRSQMAAALLDHLTEGRIQVRSAGTTPAKEIHAVVAEAMSEVGIDVSKEFPKPLSDEAVRAADVVITMGCGDACPVYPGKRYLDWELPDPAGKRIEEVRGIRDEIRRRVEHLITELSAQEDEDAPKAPASI